VAECERCRGTGFEVAVVKGKDGKDVETVRVCACRRLATDESEAALLERLRIPPRYHHCLLSEFKTDESASVKASALMKVMRYCHEYPSRGAKNSNDRGLGLLFTGSNGTGKTHLAVAALRELATSHGVIGQFWDYHELLREIRNSYDPSTAFTEYEVLEPIINMELLLLDDLGAWKMTDWMNDTLFYVLNKRYLATRPTLITTNYPDREPTAREVSEADTTLRREYLVDRIGLRLRSRLLEACAVIRLEGQDVRQAYQASNQSLLV
jgi:DNA replication protein DnaC